MKQIKLLPIFIVLLIVFGCSSDDEPINQEPEPEVEETLSISINDAPKQTFGGTTTGRSCTLVENMFTLGVQSNWNLTFDKNGNLGYFKITLSDNPGNHPRTYYSHTDFSGNYFSFNLISIDEQKQRIKGTFGGYVYYNAFDLNSESKFVRGDFDIKYINLTSAVKGLMNEAKINGVPWSRSNKYITGNNSSVVQHDVSDDDYKIMVKYERYTIVPGAYNFTPTSQSNMIQLSRYNVLTNSYIDYNCTGVMNVTQRESLAGVQGGFIMSANYNFAAVNPFDPNDVIQVTDGKVKLIWQYQN
jgi:hypothetical protein